MILPLSLKIALGLALFHWQGMYLVRDAEEKARYSAKQRARADSIKGLFVIIRAVVVVFATLGIVQL